jgi:hypothetical protein
VPPPCDLSALNFDTWVVASRLPSSRATPSCARLALHRRVEAAARTKPERSWAHAPVSLFDLRFELSSFLLTFCDHMRVSSEWVTVQEMSNIALPYAVATCPRVGYATTNFLNPEALEDDLWTLNGVAGSGRRVLRAANSFPRKS